jgi:hypothetical protein
MVANVALSVLNGVMLWGFGNYLRGQLVDSNNKLKPSDKNKKGDYNLTSPQGLSKVNHDLHNFLVSNLLQAVIFGFLLMLLAVNFRRGKGWARWAAILVLFLVVRSPFRLLGLGGDAPVAVRLVSALIGLTGVAVVVLLVLPESARYFAAVRAANAGSRPSGAAPVGLRGMFAPRQRPAATTPTVKPDATPPGPKRGAPVTPAKASGPRRGASAEPKGDAAAEPRAKAKARTSVEPAGTRPPSGSAKSRGKSRKGS